LVSFVLELTMRYPHVPEQHQALLEEWEAILRDEPDPNQTCVFCGEAIAKRSTRGPRRLYCSGRCQRAAARARQLEAAGGEWVREATDRGLIAEADADGVDYIDAFPGDHPPLNYPVVPRETEPSSEFGWAFEIIGAA
jgi:hypothetical protein